MNKMNFKFPNWQALLVISVASIIYKTIYPANINIKTNETYLLEILQNGTLDKTSSLLVEQFSESDPTLDSERLKLTKDIISACLKTKANELLKSGDSYLKENADKNSPDVLAKKLLKKCDVI